MPRLVVSTLVFPPTRRTVFALRMRDGFLATHPVEALAVPVASPDITSTPAATVAASLLLYMRVPFGCSPTLGGSRSTARHSLRPSGREGACSLASVAQRGGVLLQDV